MMVKPHSTLLFPRRGPHLGLISWYKRAKVGIVSGVTQNPQSALHGEQTLVVHYCGGWIVQSSLSRGGICRPGDLGRRIGVVGGAGEGVLSHLHGHWLDGSWRDSTDDLHAKQTPTRTPNHSAGPIIYHSSFIISGFRTAQLHSPLTPKLTKISWLPFRVLV